MKKVIIAVLLLVIGAVVTTLEISQINHAKQDDRIWVVVTQNDLNAGHQISDKDIILKSIPKDLQTHDYYSDVSALNGKILKMDIGKGIIINTMMVSEQKKHEPELGKAITAIKLQPEEILCWEVVSGDVITLVAVGNENTVFELGEFTVKGVYYQNSNSESKYDDTPVYLLVEGSKDQIKSIIKLRGSGKIEGIKVGS